MKKRPVQIQSDFFEHVWERADVDAVFRYFDGEAGGLGVSEPLDPVGYIDFYHALSSVVKDMKFEMLDWIEQDDKLFIDFVMKARARKKDKAIFWYCSAWGKYRDGKIAGGDNYLDFLDLFRQLELVPEEAVELGLAGNEILQLEAAEDTLGTEFRRLFWPRFTPLGTDQKLLVPASAVPVDLPSPEQIEILFQSAAFGMVISDHRDTILDFNEGFERIVLREKLKGEAFSQLLVGKGAEAERRARVAVLEGEIPSYRILLHLNSLQGPVRVWVSAVPFKRPGQGNLLLRSVQRDELIDDLVAMQEAERKLLVDELDEEVLRPVLELWKSLSAQGEIPLQVVRHCTAAVSRLAADLRTKVRALRNPVLQGAPLSQAWPEVALPVALDEASETSALLIYRIVSECTCHLGSTISDLQLSLEGSWVHGRIPVVSMEECERVVLLRNLCHLVGGALRLEEEKLLFQIPLYTN